MNESFFNNLKWYEDNRETLLKDYNRYFIAIEGGEVIEYSKDIQRFYDRLSKNPQNSESTLIRFISTAFPEIPVLEE